jgi:hypothetical protein
MLQATLNEVFSAANPRETNAKLINRHIAAAAAKASLGFLLMLTLPLIDP